MHLKTGRASGAVCVACSVAVAVAGAGTVAEHHADGSTVAWMNTLACARALIALSHSPTGLYTWLARELEKLVEGGTAAADACS